MKLSMTPFRRELMALLASKESPAPAFHLQQQLRTTPAQVTRGLNALVELGFVEVERQAFKLTARGQEYLDRRAAR